MRNILTTVLFSYTIFMSPQSASAVNITGKVVDELNRSIAGAITKLTNSGLMDTTNTNGEFSLSDQTNARKVDVIKGNLVSLRGNVLQLSCRGATSILIEVFNIQGRAVFKMQRHGLVEGIHTFSIPSNNSATNLHIIRIQVNGHAQLFKKVSNQLSGCTGTHEFHIYEKQENQSSHNGLVQTNIVHDTLFVSCQGYLPKKVPLDSLTGVVNVVLTGIVPIQKFRRDFSGNGVIKAKYDNGHYMVVLEKLSALQRCPGERTVELLNTAGSTITTIRNDSAAIIDADFDNGFLYVTSMIYSQDNEYESVTIEKIDTTGHTICTDTILKEDKNPQIHDDRARVIACKSNICVGVFKNDETTTLYARNVNDLHENWSLLIEPDAHRMPWAMDGGSYDEFGQMAHQYSNFLDADEAGNAYVAIPVMGGVFSTSLNFHNKYFGDSLVCKSNSGNSTVSVGAIVTKVSSAGKRIYSSVMGTVYYDEIHCLRVFNDKIITCGRCAISSFDDWDSYITVHDANSGNELYTKNYDSGSNGLFLDAGYDSLTKKFYTGGVAGWSQNPGGVSISEQGNKLLLIVNEMDGVQSDSVSLTNGPRQNQIRSIQFLGDTMFLLAGWENGPGTHSGDANAALVTADGFLEVR